MSSLRTGSFTVATALTLAAPVSAQLETIPADGSQAVTVSSTSAAAPALSFAPTLVSARTFVAFTEVTSVAPVFREQSRESENVALMIVGGAALVVGSVIGGDAGTIMMVGGGVMALVGLYRYLR